MFIILCKQQKLPIVETSKLLIRIGTYWNYSYDSFEEFDNYINE